MEQLTLGGDVRAALEDFRRENIVPIIHAQKRSHILLECHRERALCGSAFCFSAEFIKSPNGGRKYSARFKREQKFWQDATCKNCQRMARRRYSTFLLFDVFGWQLPGLGQELYEYARGFRMKTNPFPWLVLADWLDDQGSPLGERIRIHCELLTDGLSIPQYVRLVTRALELHEYGLPFEDFET